MKRTTRVSKQPKPVPAPPTLVPHTDGRWQVIDYRGYVIYCGPEWRAFELWRAHNVQPGPTRSLADVVRG